MLTKSFQHLDQRFLISIVVIFIVLGALYLSKCGLPHFEHDKGILFDYSISHRTDMDQGIHLPVRDSVAYQADFLSISRLSKRDNTMTSSIRLFNRRYLDFQFDSKLKILKYSFHSHNHNIKLIQDWDFEFKCYIIGES